MSSHSHTELANFIWNICNLLRGPYRRDAYRKVILPLTVLRRFDCILNPTKVAVLQMYSANRNRSERILRSQLEQITGVSFYNVSEFTLGMPPPESGLRSVLDDSNNLVSSLISFINGFSPNVRSILDRFRFEEQITIMDEANLLFLVVQEFSKIDLSPELVDQMQMGYVFEELIRIGAEESNQTAGEHFTPREVIKLMVNLLLSPEKDLGRSHVVKTIYDPACGTGGMLSVAENYIRELNAEARPKLFGQDLNDEAWAICRSDMLIKGQEADNIILGDTFTRDGFRYDSSGRKWRFDYMLANPPFGVDWRQQKSAIEEEREVLGFSGRFGAGTPRSNDGAFLFLQHMIDKMRPEEDGGSRIAIVFNGSPLFTGDAGSGESEIRRWIIENDWLEAIVALPEQLFYNTGIATYVWILTNRKEEERRGKIQLIDAREFWVQMEKSLGNKRRRIGDPSENGRDPDHIGEITKIFGNFEDGETRTFSEKDRITKELVERERVVSKIFDNEDFGFRKITVERPLRLSFEVNEDRVALLKENRTFQNLASSRKRNAEQREAEIAEGRLKQEAILSILQGFEGERWNDREVFLADLRKAATEAGVRLSAGELRVIVAAIGERDEEGAVCFDGRGEVEADSELRDTEVVPLKEDVREYFEREVLPHVPDAWIDEEKTRIGYEIPLNRHFYEYEPPRELEEISADIRELEAEIVKLLREVTV